ncbi:MAG: hypothetical protein U0234_08270 [Sandaracinus sp.]
MSATRRKRRVLLVASVGLATLSFVGCRGMTSGNLVPPVDAARPADAAQTGDAAQAVDAASSDDAR